MGGLPQPIRVRTDVEAFSQKSIFQKTKKIPLRDRGRGLDIAEQSLRDFFNDVSKYIRNISISLNSVLPKLPDNRDRVHSQEYLEASPCPAFSLTISKSLSPSSCCAHTLILYDV